MLPTISPARSLISLKEQLHELCGDLILLICVASITLQVLIVMMVHQIESHGVG